MVLGKIPFFIDSLNISTKTGRIVGPISFNRILLMLSWPPLAFLGSCPINFSTSLSVHGFMNNEFSFCLIFAKYSSMLRLGLGILFANFSPTVAK